MPALSELPWHWVGFIFAVLVFLAIDLGLFHRQPKEVKFREAIAWTISWFILAMMFAAGLLQWGGEERPVGQEGKAIQADQAVQEGHEGQPRAKEVVPEYRDGKALAEEFVTGYIVELALSMDNLFVIAMIFNYFGVQRKYQHRVLFWGILGALVMRGVMILGGVALVKRFDWILYLLGAFLIATGVKMIFSQEEEVHPERNIVIKLARRLFPVTPNFHGQRFMVRFEGRLALTPLALVLLMVETTDLVFAVDSIPAIFGVTQDGFIIFTSNVFAILGLRSMYFVLAEAMAYFRYLKVGLSFVLIFIGGKMLLEFKYHIPTIVSLLIVAGVIFTSIVASMLLSQWEEEHKNVR